MVREIVITQGFLDHTVKHAPYVHMKNVIKLLECHYNPENPQSASFKNFNKAINKLKGLK
jgi:hypothetical protein